MNSFGRAEVHRDTAHQGQGHEDLLKGGVRVDMRRYPLAWLVVVDGQLVEGPILIEEASDHLRVPCPTFRSLDHLVALIESELL